MRVDFARGIKQVSKAISSSSVAFSPKALPCDEFVKSANNAVQLISEKKFQKIFKNIGMSQQELGEFLNDYKKAVELNFKKTFKTIIPEGMEDSIDEMLQELRKDKRLNAFFPETSLQKCYDETVKNVISPVANIEQFGKFYTDANYQKYRNRNIKIYESIREHGGVFESFASKKAPEDVKELVNMYNEIGSTAEIMEEVVLNQNFQLDLLSAIKSFPEKEFRELLDELFPSLENLANKKAALCLFVNSSLSENASKPYLQKMVTSLAEFSRDDFFEKFKNKFAIKSETPKISELSMLTRTSPKEIDLFKNCMVQGEQGEVALRKTLQLKAYLDKASEFYDKKLSLADVKEIYQNGVLKNDKAKTAEMLTEVLKKEDKGSAQNITKHLFDAQDSIFEDKTIKRKAYGEFQSSDLGTQQEKIARKINARDKHDLISTGFFAKKIIEFVKQEGIPLTKSPITTEFIAKNMDYSSLTNLKHHQICEELSKEYQCNPSFAKSMESFFNRSDIDKQSKEIFSTVDNLSDRINGYLKKLNSEEDKLFHDGFATLDEDLPVAIKDYMQDEIGTIVKKEAKRRPQVVFSKHAILRLIGRDLIEPKNIQGQNIDFESFISQLYHEAIKNKGKDFKMSNLNGYSGLNVKAHLNDNTITVATLF